VSDSIDERIAQRHQELRQHFEHWEKTKDLIDNLIDLILNYRQSGHPGGSRSKVHMLVSLLLSGVMRGTSATPKSASATASSWAPATPSR
jgi:hypothetical protein